MRKGFTIIEVVFVFLLILGVTFLVLPKTLDSTKQARFISQWTAKYSEMEYIFTAIQAQSALKVYKQVKDAPDNGSREAIVVNIIKPYLRIKSEAQLDGYRQYYMNRKPVEENSMYSFSKFYVTDFGEIIGLKWLVPDCQSLMSEGLACGVIALDVNGSEKPNTWGKDVFGLDIYKDGITPIGKNIDPMLLKNNCSNFGQGVYCSYYYLIGGRFD